MTQRCSDRPIDRYTSTTGCSAAWWPGGRNCLGTGWFWTLCFCTSSCSAAVRTDSGLGGWSPLESSWSSSGSGWCINPGGLGAGPRWCAAAVRTTFPLDGGAVPIAGGDGARVVCSVHVSASETYTPRDLKLSAGKCKGTRTNQKRWVFSKTRSAQSSVYEPQEGWTANVFDVKEENSNKNTL